MTSSSIDPLLLHRNPRESRRILIGKSTGAFGLDGIGSPEKRHFILSSGKYGVNGIDGSAASKLLCNGSYFRIRTTSLLPFKQPFNPQFTDKHVRHGIKLADVSSKGFLSSFLPGPTLTSSLCACSFGSVCLCPHQGAPPPTRRTRRGVPFLAAPSRPCAALWPLHTYFPDDTIDLVPQILGCRSGGLREVVPA